MKFDINKYLNANVELDQLYLEYCNTTLATVVKSRGSERNRDGSPKGYVYSYSMQVAYTTKDDTLASEVLGLYLQVIDDATNALLNMLTPGTLNRNGAFSSRCDGTMKFLVSEIVTGGHPCSIALYSARDSVGFFKPKAPHHPFFVLSQKIYIPEPGVNERPRQTILVRVYPNEDQKKAYCPFFKESKTYYN